MDRRTTWKHLRAALVGFHVVAITVAAVPAPEGVLYSSYWEEPAVQAEFAAWGKRLGVAPRKLQEKLWTAAHAWSGVKNAAMRPFDGYLGATGTLQSWRMFAGPDRVPARYRVQVRTAGAPDWTTLVEQGATLEWRPGFFSRERVRAALFQYAWPGYEEESRAVCAWLAWQLFAERAEVTDVRCGYLRAEEVVHENRVARPTELKR